MRKLISFPINSIVVLSISVVPWLSAGAGCSNILGLEPGVKGDPDASAGGGGAGGDESSGPNGGTDVGSGGEECNPGEERPCYDGPSVTHGVGTCRGGTKVCDLDGSGFGACEGQVLPAVDTCGPEGAIDGNCNGFFCGETLWGHRYGDGLAQYGRAIAVDAEENVVIVGSFSGTIHFGGDPLVGEGDDDVFIAKLGKGGEHIWSKRFGDGIVQVSQLAKGVAVDGEGNVLVTGAFGGTIDFGAGEPMQSAGSQDLFVVKLSSAGDLIWQGRFGDTYNQRGEAIAADAQGNITVCGSFEGALDFDMDPISSQGGYDTFVVSFDPNGNVRWKKRFGDSAMQYCEGVAVSQGGDVLMTGQFSGSITFQSTLSSPTDPDSYVAKLDKDGNILWGIALSGPQTQRALAVAVGADDSVAVAGYAMSSITVDNKTLPSTGASDVFVLKLSPEGKLLWGDTYGDVSDQKAEAVALDAEGNVFVAGDFGGSIDFGPPLAADGTSDDMFVAKLASASGEHIWSRKLGEADNQYATSVAIGPTGSVYVGGYMNGSMNLGGGLIKTQGSFDVFLGRFEP